MSELDSIEVEPDYNGVHLTFPLTPVQVQSMLDSFREGKLLHFKYAMQLLFRSRDYLAGLPTMVSTTVEEGTRFTICGDTHGQLADLFSIFTINGTPNNTDRYLFNGDFVDRGANGVEIVLTLLAYQQLYPDGLLLNRGNHEERSQNETGGFLSEVYAKYSGVPSDPSRGALLYDVFQSVFDQMPLATLLEKSGRRVFIVHGGLFARAGVQLEHISSVHRKREIPWGRHTYEDGVFEDLLWSDPKGRLGTEASTRGAGVFFGPDVTEEFCANNAISLVIRSHEMVQEGFAYMHNNRLLTIFSASKYCGRGTNKGAFITFEPDLTNSIQQFMAGSLSSTAPAPRQGTAAESLLPEQATCEDEEAQKDANRRMLIERICLNKHDLMWFFSKADRDNTGTISRMKWAEGMRTVMAPLDLPWLALSRELVEFEQNGTINYTKFLNRYRIEMRPDDMAWQTALVENVCKKLFAVCSSLEDAYKLFDVNSDGTVEYSEFVEGLERLKLGLSKRQQYDFMQSIDTDKDGHIDFSEFASRFRVAFTRIADASNAGTPGSVLSPPGVAGSPGVSHSPTWDVRGMAQANSPGVPNAGSETEELEVDDTIKDLLQRVGTALFSGEKNAAEQFASMDTNGDGCLSKDEFATALTALDLDPPVTHEQSDALLAALDTTDSGTLNYLEFVSAFSVADMALTSADSQASGANWQRAVIDHVIHVLYEYRVELAAAFESFDLDHSGTVSKEEFRLGLQAITGAVGSPLTDEQADGLLEYLDKNGDGELSYEEFLSGFRLVDSGASSLATESVASSSASSSSGTAGAASSPPPIALDTPSSSDADTGVPQFGGGARSVMAPNLPLGVRASKRGGHT